METYQKFGIPQVRMLRVDQLTVYREVQRVKPTKAAVKLISSNLRLHAIGVLSVSLRKDGTYSLVDGQRRQQALLDNGMGAMMVTCNVFRDLTIPQEADLFRDLNRTRQVGTFDDFDKGRVAEDPECIGIDIIAREVGWTVGSGNGPDQCSCIVALRKAWRMDPSGELLRASMTALRDAYGHHDRTMAGCLVEGMARFLASRKSVDMASLVQKLCAAYPLPTDLIHRANGRRDIDGGTVAVNVEATIDRCYSTRKARA